MTASPILERYLERTPRSARASEEARQALPGGDTRTSIWFDPYPPLVAEGRGATFLDVDGNRYVELLNNYTSLVHGHAHPEVVAAVREQLEHGMSFASLHPATVRLARMLCDRVPSIERLRFTNSGTEAVLLALHVARAFTGRPLIAKAEGGYHGSWDDVQWSVAPPLDLAGDADRPTPVPASPGLSPGASESTVVIPYNDLDAALAILEPLAGRLAAVVVEPMQGSGGMIPADQSYLTGLRSFTAETGALLVFDEVISFRLAPGGAQQLYGITPDLTTLGKIIGGGLAIGAFGGREDAMALCDPSRPGGITHAGTFNGNPLAMAAGAVTLELLTDPEYERIGALGERLRRGIAELGAVHGIAVCASGLGSLLNVHLCAEPPRRFRDHAAAVDKGAARLLHLALLNEGFFMARRGLIAVSTPMVDALVDEVLAAIGRALTAVQAEHELAPPAAATALRSAP
jgi:glutamate-1-semialdehyde 2,1-aminomutase